MLAALQSGEYTVHFSGNASYASQYFNAEPTYGEADRVSVSAGSPTAGVDANLASAASISGTVTSAAGGSPLEGIMVCASPTSSSYEGSCAHTDAAGNYTVRGLAATAYTIEFSANGANYLKQYFPAKTSQGAAEPVTVAAGEEKDGVDAAMQPGGRITGTVTRAADGQAAPG